MQDSGRVRPLRFSRSGHDASIRRGTDWPGLPIEVLPVGDWEGDAELGPLPGAVGVMVYLQGSAEYLTRGPHGDLTFVARAGSAALVSGDRPARVLRCRGQAQVVAVDLSAGWLGASLGSYRPPLPSHLAAAQQHRLSRGVLGLLRRARQPQPPDPLEVEDASFRFVADLLETSTTQGAPGGVLGAAACRQLRDYVHDHISSPVRHGAMARVAGLPPRQFTTEFKQAFGATPYQYALMVRLCEAARLMRTTRRALAEIAYDLGFSSQAHFSTAFRRAFGVPPREYARGWRSTIVGRS